MVYLKARASAPGATTQLYKSPSSIDLTNSSSSKLLFAPTGLYQTYSRRSFQPGSAWTLNGRNGHASTIHNNCNNIIPQQLPSPELSPIKSSYTITNNNNNNNNNNSSKYLNKNYDKNYYNNNHNGSSNSIIGNGLGSKSKSMFNLAKISTVSREPELISSNGNGNGNGLLTVAKHHRNGANSIVNGSNEIRSNNRIISLSNKDRRTNEQILMAKHRASILWLIAKANDDGRIPQDLRDPFYRDHNGHELLKPWITQRLANAELYGRALANIYGIPEYSTLGHQDILQLLTRRGVYSDMMAGDEPITETLLLKTSPVKLNAHMVIIECILMLYIREILIAEKVGEVVSRFSGQYSENFDSYGGAGFECPASSDPEEVALFWVNRACCQLNSEISRDYLIANDGMQSPDEPCVLVPSLEELSDMCDGCSLFGLLSFYCPNNVDWREICLKQDISIADSIYNLQRVQYFCAEHFPSDICFLSLEDFLYLPEPIVPNFLVFIADLLFLFEIQPVDCVIPPCIRLYPESAYTDEFQPNYPALPTPSEMKARSLKHQSWNDSLEGSCEANYYQSSNHHHNPQLYDKRSSMYKTASNTALNYNHSSTTSRRNSLNNSHNNNNNSNSNNNGGSRILHRRSSVLSNGSEIHHQTTPPQVIMNADLTMGDYATVSNGQSIGQQSNPQPTHPYHHIHHQPHLQHHQLYNHMPPDEENDRCEGVGENGESTQLSSYFSTLNNNRNSSKQSSPFHQSSDPMNDPEYYPKPNSGRTRTPTGQLNEYFSSLSIAAAGLSNNTMMETPAGRTGTHVRAKIHHPNNTDNVKSLLNQPPNSYHLRQQSYHDSSQTTSSETSSVAESSECSDFLRAQLSEKRKKIELEHQQEREKRASSDHNFRQEVFKTLKGTLNPSDSVSDIDGADGSNSTGKLSDNNNNNNGRNNSNNNNDDDNLTFEIHELNPIRREKTFTHVAKSASSTYVRKNLFSASEDLKQSMTDLNYANSSNAALSTPLYDSITKANEVASTTSSSTLVAGPFDSAAANASTATTNNSIGNTEIDPELVSKYSTPPQSVPNNSQSLTSISGTDSSVDVVSPSQSISQASPHISMVPGNTTPRRSQWGQPMIPLAGHYAAPGPIQQQPPPPQQAAPPSWSQTTGPYASPDWYGGQPAGQPPPQHPQPSPYQHPHQSPYSYGYHPQMAPPQPGAPMRPYSLHMDPHVQQQHQQYSPYGMYGAPAESSGMPSIGYMPGMQPQQGPHSQPQAQHQQSQQQQPTVNYSPQMPSANETNQIGATFRIAKNNNQNDYSTPQPLQSHPNTPNQTHQDQAQYLNDQNQAAAMQNYHNSFQQQAESTPSSQEKQKQAAFFISFDDERPLNPKNNQNSNRPATATINRGNISPDKQPLTRTATQTLVAAPAGQEKDQKRSEDRPKQYEVRPTPPMPAVAFEIGVNDDLGIRGSDLRLNDQRNEVEADEDESGDLPNESTDPSNNSNNNTPNRSSISEYEMTKKKETIMKHSLKRKIMLEEKRLQKEQEMAAKREEERSKREQSERKKEEDRAKRAFILEQYKQRKQLEEELEKNGGPLPVSRSSSTLVLNRAGQQSGVTMRPQRLLSGGRPRPKSLHSTVVGAGGLEGSSSPFGDSSTSSRYSSSRDEIDQLGRHGANSSRPQSALSSQVSSAVTTPTGYGDHSFAGDTSSTGPASSNFYNSEYNGPKLFVKPSQKSNKALILNAINAVLAGAVNAETNRRVAQVINHCDSKYYLILFRNSGLQYRAIYSYYPERDEVVKLDGIGPRTVSNEMIDKFYKYNSGTKNFTPIHTKHLCVTIDAFTIHNNLWMNKKQQQQQQQQLGTLSTTNNSTTSPRRFNS